MINLQRRLKCCGFCHNCSSAVFELLIIAAFWPAENWRRDCKRREGETGNTGSKYCNLCCVVYSWFFKLVGKLFTSHHPTMLMLLHCEANDFKQSLGHSTATFIHSFISGMHHYECVVPNVDISLQSGQFWATSVAYFRKRFIDVRSCWIVFIHVVRGIPVVSSRSPRGIC